MTFETIINNQIFTLHSSGALFWQNKKTLLIADIHLGKVMHFRKHGYAIPNEAIHRNFEKLKEVTAYFLPEKIVFLGDLFHSTKNSEWDLFVQWCQNSNFDLLLVEGNHDIIALHHYEELGIKVVDNLKTDNFLLTHHPIEAPGFFNFAGHIHPGISLRGFARSTIKLPCFLRRKQQMILPAFGAFTGLGILRLQEGDIGYAITEEEIFLIQKPDQQTPE